MKVPADNASNSERFYSPLTLFWTFLFGLGFLGFELLALPYSRTGLTILGKHLSNGSYHRFLVVIIISIMAFGLFLGFIYAALASPRLYKPVYFLIFSVLIGVGYGYYGALGRFLSLHDVEVAMYASNWGIIRDAIPLYFSFLALIPMAIFGLLLLINKKSFRVGWLPLGIVIFSLGIFFFGTTYFTRNSFYVHSFNHGIRTMVSLPVIWTIGTISQSPRNIRYYAPRDEIEFRSSAAPKNNVILIVDESVRPDHLSLNGYFKPTTRTLEMLNQKGFIRNWGTASAGTTCSGTANALILTGLKDLPDREFNIFKAPVIYQYAMAMNYKTYYIDGQNSSYWNGKASDLKYVDNWITAASLERNSGQNYENDVEIARRVKAIIRKSTGNFIWINKFGVHKPYTNSYPDEGNRLPKDSYFVKYERSLNDKSLISQYDKAIRYNLEGFFSELSEDENFGQNTIFLYTSDHGQSLREEGATASHCSNTKAEAAVPLFLMSSPENLPGVDTGFKASHSNIFATLLDLMNFPEDKRKYNYGISLLKARKSDSRRRFYFAGDLHNPDEGKRYPFDE